jgi:hypothetical protein
METEPASETFFFTKLNGGKSPPPPPQKKTTHFVNLSPAVFSFFIFLIFENGANRLSRNVGNELPLCGV